MELTWILLDELARQYGDGFYLLDLPLFEENYRSFLGEFRRIYPKSSIAYSYKTNYVPALCRHLNDLGGYAEVVSGMEYQLALRVGVAPTRIIFNGPYKTRDEIQCALLAGSLVNIESFREIDIVQAAAERFPGREFCVGVRCNFPINDGEPSRFGFDTASEDIDAAFAWLRKIPNLRVTGLHCHFSTPDKTRESYALRIRKLMALAERLLGPDGPQMLNIGGGYFSHMPDELQRQFNFRPTEWKDYAEAIGEPLAQAYPGGNGPELILEPGTALVANVMSFVSRVVELKTIGGKTIAHVAGSIHNIKPTSHQKEIPVRVFKAAENTGEESSNGPVDVMGYTCMEHDCLCRDFKTQVVPGDFLVFDNVGAYTIVMKPPFIRPSPAMVAMKPDESGFALVKRRETTSDVFASYIITDSMDC